MGARKRSPKAVPRGREIRIGCLEEMAWKLRSEKLADLNQAKRIGK